MESKSKLMNISATVLFVFALVSAKSHAVLIGTLEQLAPTAITFVQGVDFVTFDHPLSTNNSATGDVTASLFVVDFNSISSGCDAADFAGFLAGSIAVVRRSGCFFSDKALNATAAGAVGILIVNNIDPLGSGTGLSMNDPTSIPALLLDDDAASLLLGGAAGNQPLANVVHLSVSRVAQAPLPATSALLALGFACLAIALRKKRRNPGLRTF